MGNRLANIAARRRSPSADARMGWLLAWIAGNVDATGFVIAQQYTSHVTGFVSAAGDDLAHHAPKLALASAMAVLIFVAGSACCTLVVRLARWRRLHAPHAWPLLGEGLLLGAACAVHAPGLLAAVLCFAMGWQNAFATKVTHAEIRTTHVTGIVTDIGIASGRLLARLAGTDHGQPADDWARLRLLGGLFAAFLAGAASGTALSMRAGQASLVLPALGLALAAALPLHLEIRAWQKRSRTPSDMRTR